MAQPQKVASSRGDLLDMKPEHVPGNRPWCGPAAVRAVLSRHRRQQYLPTVAEIAAALPMNKWGIRLGDLGTYLLGQDMHVTMYMWIHGMQPRLMGLCNGDLLEQALRLPLTASAGDTKRAWKSIANSTIRFRKAGGRVFLKPVLASHIAHETRNGNPPIVSLNPWLLWQKGRRDLGHYVVPVGVTNEELPGSRFVHFLDSTETEQVSAPLDRFMHACHVWQGSALLIQPR
jgi:hypothetical protein